MQGVARSGRGLAGLLRAQEAWARRSAGNSPVLNAVQKTIAGAVCSGVRTPSITGPCPLALALTPALRCSWEWASRCTTTTPSCPPSRCAAAAEGGLAGARAACRCCGAGCGGGGGGGCGGAERFQQRCSAAAGPTGQAALLSCHAMAEHIPPRHPPFQTHPPGPGPRHAPQILATGLELSRNKIIVSTVGLVPEMRRFIASGRAKLAVSLHATTDEVRGGRVRVGRRVERLSMRLSCTHDTAVAGRGWTNGCCTTPFTASAPFNCICHGRLLPAVRRAPVHATLFELC